MTYAIRAIDLTIQLGTGSFGASGANTLTLSGLRVNATLGFVLPPGASTAVIQVYGLPLNLINQLTRAGLQYTGRFNQLTLAAGDAAAGVSQIFSGNIIDSHPAFQGAASPFIMSATTTNLLQMTPVKPGTFPGTVDVATIMGQMAQQAGLKLENNGVDVKLSNPYFPGTIIDQIYSCAKAANIYAYIDRVTGRLAIWPKTGSRSGTVPVISPATGMIGYPVFQNANIVVRTLFNPYIVLGGQIKVESQLTPASGVWNVLGVDYNLASQLPDGPWESVLTAFRPQGM